MGNKDRVVTVRIEEDISDGMERQRQAHGTPISEQIRRALRAWLETQGMMKAGRPRAANTRKRP